MSFTLRGLLLSEPQKCFDRVAASFVHAWRFVDEKVPLRLVPIKGSIRHSCCVRAIAGTSALGSASWHLYAAVGLRSPSGGDGQTNTQSLNSSKSLQD